MSILSNVTLKVKVLNLNQIQVFSKYTGIPESEIETCLNNPNKKTNNLLRIDKDASVGFKWVVDRISKEYKIRMHDFADTVYRGDIFDIVGVILHLNPSNNKQFVAICNHILEYGESFIPITYDVSKFIKNNKCNTLTIIKIIPRAFTPKDLKYWKSVGILKEDLAKNNVFAVEQYYVNDELAFYRYKANDPCYAYYIDTINGQEIWKLYFIARGRNGDKRARFITNNHYPLEGITELTPADCLIITKGRGETILLRRLIPKVISKLRDSHSSYFTGELKIVIINFTTETIKLTKTFGNTLKKEYKYIYTNGDFDREGIRLSNYHKRHFRFIPKMLTNGTRNTIDYKAKDIRDYYKAFGEQATLDLLETIILQELCRIYI